MKRLLVLIAALPALGAMPPGEARAPFAHPGALHTRADLDRIRAGVKDGREPWKSGFAQLQADRHSAADWRIRGGFPVVVRGAGEEQHNADLAEDGSAAYQNALMWAITGDEANARKAAAILNAWSASLREIKGHDAILAASLYGDKYVNAAELLRATYPAWPKEDAERCAGMFRNVFHPVIREFAPFANGNWGTGCIKTEMGIAVYLNDRPMFDRAVDYYLHGAGNGSLSHYVVNETGQCQESGRDQQHTQLGLGHMAEACEIGWNEGLDLYGAQDNRLLRGFEYTARYNLGEEVPFQAYTDVTGRYRARTISSDGRGRLRPIYEMVWNHYKNRRGQEAPFTQRAVEKLRPEGAAFQADHPGFGTLLFFRPFAPAR
jgi:hypothetical protein